MQPDIYTPYIVASYAVTLVVIGGVGALVLYGYFRARTQSQKGKKQ